MLAGLRSSGVIPPVVAGWMKSISTLLTVAAMAALGLGVNLQAIARVGRSVMLTISASLAVLIVSSVALIHVLSIR